MDNRFRVENLKRRFAKEMHRFGMFKDKTRSPDGRGFRLRLHETEPDAPLSPYYIDLRLLQSYPLTAKSTAVELFREMTSKFPCDLLADVPTAITPIVSSLSDRVRIPMVTPRAAKTHGGGGNVNGVWHKGEIALLFDDLITEAHSTLEVVQVLRANGIEVEHVFVFLDRQQGGRDKLATEGLTLHTAFTISELLRLYRDTGAITTDLYEEIEAYRKSQ